MRRQRRQRAYALVQRFGVRVQAFKGQDFGFGEVQRRLLAAAPRGDLVAQAAGVVRARRHYERRRCEVAAQRGERERRGAWEQLRGKAGGLAAKRAG